MGITYLYARHNDHRARPEAARADDKDGDQDDDRDRGSIEHPMRNDLGRGIIPTRRVPHHPLKVLCKHEAIHRLGPLPSQKKKSHRRHDQKRHGDFRTRSIDDIHSLTWTEERRRRPREEVGRKRAIRVRQVCLRTAVPRERCAEFRERARAGPREERGYRPHDEARAHALRISDYHAGRRAVVTGNRKPHPRDRGPQVKSQAEHTQKSTNQNRRSSDR